MTLRRKFLVALVGLVVFLSLVFGVISFWSMQSLQGRAARYLGQNIAQQWQRIMTFYYDEHGSWSGLQDYLDKIVLTGSQERRFWRVNLDNVNFYVFDNQEIVIGSLNGKDNGKALSDLPQAKIIKSQLQPLQNNGINVGYTWLDESFVSKFSQLPDPIAASLIRAMLIGLILTSLLGVVLGVLLTRRFTVPLRNLTEGVKQVGQGDLTPRLEVQGEDDIALLTRAFNGMTEQLRRNEEVRSNMVADIAHELRTPLAVILGKLESIQEGVLPSNPEVLLPIQDETLRLIRLVRDLQQLTLAEAGKLPLSLRKLDLRNLLERILEQFAYEFQERHISSGIDGVAPLITADPDRLTQVFVNLIGNSLLHTPQGGKIIVHLDDRGIPPENYDAGDTAFFRDTPKESLPEIHWVNVSVEDTGEGIPEEVIGRIFDRFYRVDKSRERETGHTGLGLAIAKEFIQAHGGRITVQSTIGAGTTFTVWLPIQESKFRSQL